MVERVARDNTHDGGQEKSSSLVLEFAANPLAIALFGEHDAHLRLIEERLGVVIHPRGNTLVVSGRKSQLKLARHLLHSLYAILEQGGGVDRDLVEDALRLLEGKPSEAGSGAVAAAVGTVGGGEDRDTPWDAASGLWKGGQGGEGIQVGAEGEVVIRTPGRVIRSRSQKQAMYVKLIQEKDLTISVGPAGTGKTYLAVAMAVTYLLEGRVGRIILTRPAVEAGERLGFLPGDLQAKVDPYLRPLYDALHEMLGFDKVERMMAQGDLEIAPLAYMRGRTLHEAFIILDEAQNTTPEQMKMFLTRFGSGSKVVVAGDATQVDLPRGQQSGLAQALTVLDGIAEIGLLHFEDRDVVRHALVRKIVQAYEQASANGKGSGATATIDTLRNQARC